jgi:aquaporin Z
MKWDLRTVDTRTVVSEFLGTLLLVLFGVGSVVLAGEFIGTVGVSLAFGFVLLALVWALGPVSGAQLNPAVTLGMLVARRIGLRTAVEYWVAQLLGAIAGAAILFLLAEQVPGLETSGAFGTNGYGDRSGVRLEAGGAFLAEILMTFLLVYVFLSVVHRVRLTGLDALPIGLTLAVVQLMGLPLTGTSVNPARSIGPAVFAGTDALSQVWLFLLAPLVGGVIAALVHGVVHLAPEPGEETAGPAPTQ